MKKSVKRKKEVVEYLLRADLDQLGIDESFFEELKTIFIMFDMDKDGVLSLKEFERLMSCLGRAGFSLYFL